MHLLIVLIHCFIFTIKESLCDSSREQQSINDFSNSLALKEELVIEEIEEVPDFNAAMGVKKWLNLNLGRETYVLGIKAQSLSLLALSRREANIGQASEDTKIFQHEILSASMFKVKNAYDVLEGYVVVSLNQPKPHIEWFKIENQRLHLIYKWEREHQVQDILYFPSIGGDNLLFELEANSKMGKIYQFEVVSDRPHIWFVENLLLTESAKQPRVSNNGKSLYLSLIENGKLVIYNYRKLCASSSIGNFVQIPLNNIIEGVESVEWFESRGKTYLVTRGGTASLYNMDNGVLKLVKKLGYRMDTFIISRNSERQDVQILAKSDKGDVFVYGQNDSEDVEWVKKDTPRCRKIVIRTGREPFRMNDLLSECIGGTRSWEGAVYLDSKGLESVLFAHRLREGELFKLHFEFKPVSYKSRQTLQWYKVLGKELGKSWANLQASIDVVAGKSHISGSEGMQHFCRISEDLTEFSHKIEDFRLRMNRIDCSPKMANLPTRFTEYEIVPSSLTQYKDEERIEIDVKPPPTRDSYKEDHIVEHEELPGSVSKFYYVVVCLVTILAVLLILYCLICTLKYTYFKGYAFILSQIY